MMNIHCHTPTLTTIDSRGLTVRSITYCRSASDADAEVRINRTRFDEAGRVVAQWDPRLWVLHGSDASTPANAEHLYTLTGIPLRSLSVDAGLRVSLPGEVGQLLHSWDGRGSQQHIQYDTLLRPLAIFEHESNAPVSCTERYIYGSVDPICIDHNQYGQLIRHDDPAGTRHFNAFGLTGQVIEQTQQFLQALNLPHWPSGESERDCLLEPGGGASTLFAHNGMGEVVQQIDALGNRNMFAHTVDGQLYETRLHLKNAPGPQMLVHGIQYSACGQIQQQTAGNGVVSVFDYCPRSDRLLRLRASVAQHKALQDLNYVYDPVGNILSIEDKALPIRYFANQCIEPINRYRYDSLYQLISATGWEAGAASKGPAQIRNPQAVATYRQTYRYDAGGNLLETVHQGAQSHGLRLTAGKYSNRCLPEQDARPLTEAQIASGFDQSGNLLALDKGRTLSWDLRNQLSEVRPVERESGLDDNERYIYGADGMRQRKIRSTQTRTRTLISETRYLPGLEMRIDRVTGTTLGVITAQTGRISVQVLQWETPLPRQLACEQLCYSLADHLGSCTLELDSNAKIVSRETYHPYATTAFSERGNSSESSFRTLRYSAKERDATGLYYYGLRYCVMGWRWINPDPSGVIYGLNQYRAVRNNPIVYRDPDGLVEVSCVDKEDRPYDTLAEQGAIHPLQAAGMGSVRRYFSNTTDSATRNYRDQIPVALNDVIERRGPAFTNTHEAHVIAAARTGTAVPAGSVLYHSGELTCGMLNVLVGEKITSEIVGPLTCAVNSPIEDQAVLAARREGVADVIGVVGAVAKHARNPVVSFAGQMAVKFSRLMKKSEAQTQMQYAQLTDTAIRYAVIPAQTSMPSMAINRLPVDAHFAALTDSPIALESLVSSGRYSAMNRRLFAAAFDQASNPRQGSGARSNF
ncbi:RHS repeat-associated core domain-containing protein [Pseudomonas sp. ML2-2023-6]|uniref:RHS repeat-associated core domain-containing protein n=1 Tax=Pseudomonas sp. ML2-2023-6 TaxID=3122376 RepID=UPI0030D2A543